MNPRRVAISARDRARRARFEAWIARLRLELGVRGARLEVDAPHGLAFDEPPFLRIRSEEGGGRGLFTLRIGERVHFGRGVELEIWAGATNVLELGDRSFVMDQAHISLRGGAIRMAPHASFRIGTIIKSEGELILGRYAGVSHYGVVHCAERIEFHDYAGTADRVTVVDSEKAIDGGDTYFLDQPLRTKPVVIGRNTFIASNAVVTAGTEIGPNAVVGANAVLTGKSFPGGWIIGGIPAKPLRALPATEAAERAAAESTERRS